MSEEKKNPLIESFLKLQERVTPIKQQGPMPISGERVNASGTGYEATGLSTQKSMADLTKTGSNFANLGVDRYKQSSAPPAASAPAAATSGFSQMTQPIVKQAAAAGDMYKANMNQPTSSFADKTKEIESKFKIAAPGKLEGGNLKVGSRGDDVKALQQKLGVTADGIFGPKTQAALTALQKQNNLKADGIYGTQSKSFLDRQSSLKSLRDNDPEGAKNFAQSQIDKPEKTFGSGSIQTKSAIGGTRIFPNSNKMSTGSSANFGGSTPTLDSTNLIKTKRSSETLMAGMEMTNPLIEAFKKLHETKFGNLFEKAKKLDAVGKEDEDIDNDGDENTKTDRYLHNRRKAIAKAMREAIDPKIRPPVKKDPYGGDETSPSSMGIQKPDYATPSTKQPTPPTPPKSTPTPNKKPIVGNSKVIQTGPNSSTVTKSTTTEEVEYIDEAAGGLPAEHKKAIANHVKKMWGKGTVTFDKQDGKHFVTHNDGIESQVHSIHMKGGKAHVTHFMTVQEEVEQIDEILDRPGKELEYALKNIGSKLKAGLTGDKNTVRKRERGEKSFKKNAAKKKDEREMDSYRNKLAGKALRDMGQKTGLGMYYDKIHTEEVEQIDELFSEAELDHMASVLEEGRRKPGEEPKKRGRKAGVKVGSYNKQGGSSNTEGSTEPKNLAAQIRFASQTGANDGKGNFMLKHPKTGETKAVPAKAATEFYSKYVGSEKPSQKEAHHDAFLAKHFGSSEKPASKSGITLPNIPSLRK